MGAAVLRQLWSDAVIVPTQEVLTCDVLEQRFLLSCAQFGTKCPRCRSRIATIR